MTQAQINGAFARGELSAVQAAAVMLDRRRAEKRRTRRALAAGLFVAAALALGWVVHGCSTPGPLPPVLPPPPCDFTQPGPCWPVLEATADAGLG